MNGNKYTDPSWINKKYNKLTIETHTIVGKYAVRFLCKCECGNTIVVKPYELLNGHVKSCGCAYTRYDLSGTETEFVEVKEFLCTTIIHGQKCRVWLCKCRKCGNDHKLSTYQINDKHNHCTVCCSQSGKHHGFNNKDNPISKKLVNVLTLMKHRCYNKNDKSYKNYGGRGITICNEWMGSPPESFVIWAINNGYQDGLTIDRINNDGNYEPSNCRWATHQQQATNRRNLRKTKSRFVGVRQTNSDRFESTIVINNQNIYIGVFDSEELAVQARNDYIQNNNLPHSIQKYEHQMK